MLAHNVYFTLIDDSPAAVERLVAECHKYLAPRSGIVSYAAGTLADLTRDVNDRDYHVSLNILFADRPSLDAYAVAPEHLEFIERNKSNWRQVRVFDADVSGPPAE